MIDKYRIGQGWDRHRLTSGNGFHLGGIFINSKYRVVAHSDGDVALHALIDSLLGAAGMGDIGKHFPPNEKRWENADSKQLLRNVVDRLKSDDWKIVNIDLTIIFQAEKLGSMRTKMEQAIAESIDQINSINIKFKSGEDVGPTGRCEAIEAQSIVLIKKEC